MFLSSQIIQIWRIDLAITIILEQLESFKALTLSCLGPSNIPVKSGWKPPHAKIHAMWPLGSINAFCLLPFFFLLQMNMLNYKTDSYCSYLVAHSIYYNLLSLSPACMSLTDQKLKSDDTWRPQLSYCHFLCIGPARLGLRLNIWPPKKFEEVREFNRSKHKIWQWELNGWRNCTYHNCVYPSYLLS